MKILLLMFILTACGKTMEIQVTTPNGITVGPDFKGASQLCNTRYGVNTPGSEACFLDYRTYYTVRFEVSIDNIIQYCQKYTDPLERTACEQNLIDLFKVK